MGETSPIDRFSNNQLSKRHCGPPAAPTTYQVYQRFAAVSMILFSHFRERRCRLNK